MKITTKRERTRFKLSKTGVTHRVSVNKSSQYFSAQVLELVTGNVVASIHQKTFEKSAKLKDAKPVEIIQKMGESLGKELLSKKITEVAYDRSGYVYHGKVKAFADGLREAGLKF